MPPHKIDQQQIYPCVCSRKGQLKPIVLTDAFGCDRCASIFTIQGAEGDTLVQLDTIDPFQGSWRWQGKGWQQCRLGRGKSPVRYAIPPWVMLSLSILCMILVLWITPSVPLLIASGLILFLSIIMQTQ